MKVKRTIIILMLLALCACGIAGCGKNAAGSDAASNESVDIKENAINTGDVPEDIQTEGVDIKALAELPQYEYSEREISVTIDGQNIYGIAYIPDTGDAMLPLVVCSHGLGGSYRSCVAYAEQLASHGIAAYCFDFRGGGGSRSDGSTTEMSVMTEVSDLEGLSFENAHPSYSTCADVGLRTLIL